MKKIHSFDYVFDADLNAIKNLRDLEIGTIERWALEDDEAEERANVRDVFNNQNWGIPDETRDAYDYDDAYDFTEKRADLEDLAKDNFWDR